tara:strand:+ start:3360 stop:3497 length:138 start_codon:yes stop_codon:yes gene_type:complete
LDNNSSDLVVYKKTRASALVFLCRAPGMARSALMGAVSVQVVLAE